jgi:hypothetical protein
MRAAGQNSALKITPVPSAGVAARPQQHPADGTETAHAQHAAYTGGTALRGIKTGRHG